MRKAEKRLYVFCDMEGASQVSPSNARAMHHGSAEWRSEGRAFLTSDLLAVCEAAFDAGVDEVVVNDAHDGGRREPNVLVDRLPRRVRVLGRPHFPDRARRAFREDPWGIVMVGQHAMYGGGGFAPHTIQSPPIGRVTVNGIPMAEMGLELALFPGARFLAVVGDAAAVREAEVLCPGVAGVAVKDLERASFPSAEENHARIRETVAEALLRRDEAPRLGLLPPFRFTMSPVEGWRFDPGARFPMHGLAVAWFRRIASGSFGERQASWRSGRMASGLMTLNMLRMFMAREPSPRP